MTLELTHIWLLVDNISLVRDFYRDSLGIPVLNDLGEFVEFAANSQFQLSLFTRDAFHAGEPKIALNPIGGQRAVLAFAVHSLDEYCGELRAHGIDFVSGETNHPEWGLRTAFLHDPDGNLVCLYEDVSAS